MNMLVRFMVSWSLVCLSACALEVEDPNQDGSDVVPTTQALTSFQLVTTVIANTLFSLGPVLAVFEDDQGEFCPQDGVETLRGVNFGGGSVVTTQGCNEIGAATADNQVFAFDTTHNDIIAPLTPSGAIKLADTNGNVKGKMLVDSTHVYWTDDTGLRKVPRGGGARTTLVSHAEVELMAREGARLFFLQHEGCCGLGLFRVQTDGSSKTIVHSSSNGAFEDLSFDANFFYWVNNAVSPRSVHRLPKAGGQSTALVPGSNKLHFPRSNGSNLYWFEEGANRIRRRTSGGVVSDAVLNIPQVQGMTLTSTDLVFVEKVALSSQMRLWKGGLP
jgi:hypothetical protein